jgi:predicted RNA-binding protein associated with RNAse of E/G family
VVTPELLDEDELEHAERERWVSRALVAAARAEATRLIEAAKRGEWPPSIVAAWTRERASDAVSREVRAES